MTASDPGLYVYAITRAGETDLSGARAVGAAAHPRTVAHDGLALVVSDIAPAELEDVATDDVGEGSPIAEMARAHDEVVRAAAEQTATLPLRFGTVVADQRAATELLADRADRARELLAVVDGHREWGVRLRETEQQATETAAIATPAASGTEYLARRRKARADANEQRDRLRADAEKAHRALAAKSRSTLQRSPREPDVLFDAAYLVGTAGEGDFLAEAERLAADLAAGGLQLETVGPWPPYSFARDGLAEVSDE